MRRHLICPERCSFHFSWVAASGSVTKTVPCFTSGTNFCWAVKVDWNLRFDGTIWHLWHIFGSFSVQHWVLLSTVKSPLIKPFFEQPSKFAAGYIFQLWLYCSVLQHLCLRCFIVFIAPFLYPVRTSFSLTAFPLSSFISLAVCLPHLPLSLSLRYNKGSAVWRLAGREPAEGWRRFQSRASWQNRACKICAASRSHPSSFFVHLHLNSACLWIWKQLRSQRR